MFSPVHPPGTVWCALLISPVRSIGSPSGFIPDHSAGSVPFTLWLSLVRPPDQISGPSGLGTSEFLCSVKHRYLRAKQGRSSGTSKLLCSVKHRYLRAKRGAKLRHITTPMQRKPPPSPSKARSKVKHFRTPMRCKPPLSPSKARSKVHTY